MPRVRANDYHDKKSTILNTAAHLFAEYGYAGCKMEQIAERCGVSKSMLYHYFDKKEDVLFEILQQHILSVHAVVNTYTKKNSAKNTEEFFRGLVAVYLQPSQGVHARHVVAMHDMRYLTDEQKAKQEKDERDVLKLVNAALAKIAPDTDKENQHIYSLLLLGMMNWIELWYRPSGKLSPSEFYDRVSHLFLHGYLEPFTASSPMVKTSARKKK